MDVFRVPYRLSFYILISPNIFEQIGLAAHIAHANGVIAANTENGVAEFLKTRLST